MHENLSKLLNIAVEEFDSQFASSLRARDVSDPFQEGYIWMRQWEAISSYDLWDDFNESFEGDWDFGASQSIVEQLISEEEIWDVGAPWKNYVEELFDELESEAVMNTSLPIDVVSEDQLSEEDWIYDDEEEEASEGGTISEAYWEAISQTEDVLGRAIKDFVSTELDDAKDGHEEQIESLSYDIAIELKRMIDPFIPD